MTIEDGRSNRPHLEISKLTVTAVAMLCVALPSRAAELNVTVSDASGHAVENAVVELMAEPEQVIPSAEDAAPTAMRQRDQQFTPEILVVQTGSSVEFPNDDPVLHHVYSFSPAKSFELGLYGNDEVPSITFERAGPIALGCNIHDNMRAYIYVSSATYFALTLADGSIAFQNVPASNYTLSVWHPRLRKPKDVLPTNVLVSDRPTQNISIVADIRPTRTSVVDKYERGSYE